MSLTGKVALVTGSSRGLGAQIALRLAAHGADLVVNYARDADSAAEVAAAAQQQGVRAVCVQADVSRSAEVDKLFDKAVETFGKIDIVVANAGLEKVNIAVSDISDDDFEQLMRINTFGPFYVMRAAARRIADGGRIINVASSTAVFPKAGMGLYGTSKSGPRYLAKVLSQELGPRQITVNNLIPGAVSGSGIFADTTADDPFVRELRDSVPLGRLATASDVADVAQFLASAQSLFVTGQDIVMNGGGSQ